MHHWPTGRPDCGRKEVIHYWAPMPGRTPRLHLRHGAEGQTSRHLHFHCELGEVRQNRGLDDNNVTASMRQISSWSTTEGVGRISCPPKWDATNKDGWIQALRTGIKERKTELKTIRKGQQKENLTALREAARQRMDRPREKEIARLMGKQQ